MDPDTIIHTAEFLSTGSISTVIAILLIIIVLLIWERVRLISKLDNGNKQLLQAKKEENDSLKEIVEIYHQGNINLIQTLTEIKGVLSNIQMYKR